MSIQLICEALELTLSPSMRATGEQRLNLLEQQPRLAEGLLHLVGEGGIQSAVRLAGSLYLKNFVRRQWNEVISTQERESIKKNIVQVMAASEKAIQRQLSETIALIAQSDFPDTWPELVSQLVHRLDGNDLPGSVAVLKTLHRLCKNYRSAFRSDELYTEINFVLSHVATPILDLYTALVPGVKQSSGQTREILLQMLTYMNKTVVSLCSQDLPQFFEDNCSVLMSYMKEMLSLDYDFQKAEEFDENPTIEEKMRRSVAEIAILFATRYEEEFVDLPYFVSTLWRLVTVLPGSGRFDKLSISCMRLISLVASQERHINLFSDVSALQTLANTVVLPNVRLREKDLCLLDEEPLEFVRREADTNDSLSSISSVFPSISNSECNSRREAAVVLAQSLLQMQGDQFSTILAGLVSSSLSSYESNPRDNWTDLDCALHLLTALAPRVPGQQQKNSQFDVVSFYSTRLQGPLGDPDVNFVVALGSLRFLTHFRFLIPPEMLVNVIPVILKHLNVSKTKLNSSGIAMAVSAYAAIALDRILAVVHHYTSIEHLMPLITQSMMQAALLSENNEFFIRALHRSISLLHNQSAALSEEICCTMKEIFNRFLTASSIRTTYGQALLEVLALIISRPQLSSPSFILSTLEVTYAYVFSNQDSSQQPYAFHLLAVMCECRPDLVCVEKGSNGGAKILQICLIPAFWSNPDNLTPLMRLIQSSVILVPLNNLSVDFERLFGLFQRLSSSTVTDVHAFRLASVIIFGHRNSNFTIISRFLPACMTTALRTMQRSSRKARSVIPVLYFMCSVIISGCSQHDGWTPDLILKLLDGIQSGLLPMLINSFSQHFGAIRDKHDRRIIALGLVLLVTKVNQFYNFSEQSLVQLINGLVQILPNVTIVTAKTDDLDIFHQVDSVEGTWRIRTVQSPKHLISQSPSEIESEHPANLLIAYLSGSQGSLLMSRLNSSLMTTLSNLLHSQTWT